MHKHHTPVLQHLSTQHLHSTTISILQTPTMADWSFLRKLGEDIAERTGITTEDVWKTMLSGHLAIRSEQAGSGEGGSKDYFTEEEMHGFSECLKEWILEHPMEVAMLVACIAAAPTAVLATPAMINMLGLGPLGPVVGKLYPVQMHVQDD
jgi:hypothetical protein